MSTETAPESCPFCGGADGIERKIYRETTIERLTRERDLAMAALERLDARVKRLESAGDALAMSPCCCVCDGPCEHVPLVESWNAAKEAKP